jgi:septum formation protein
LSVDPSIMAPEFVLASASPRRRLLLEQEGYHFIVRPSHVEEPDPALFPDAVHYVTYTAWVKARASAQIADWMVLGADTVAVAGGEILGKPADRDDADRILRLLSGTTHDVMTGVCLYFPKAPQAMVTHVVTTVCMKPLSTTERLEYLDSGLWEGKAGAYGIQDRDDPFVTAVEGSYTNVMGLPMERLQELLNTVKSQKAW